MMPLIALTVSLLFSGFLIVRDCLRRRSVSVAIWVPTILVMVLSSRPASLWVSGRSPRLGIQNANEQSTSIVDQMFFLTVLLLCFIIATSRGMKWGRLITANNAIVLFYVYLAVSILWSSDPTGSAKRLFKDVGLMFAMAVIFTEKDPLDAMRAVYVRSAFLMLPLSIVFIKYLPAYGRAYDIRGDMNLTGVTTQKNSLGEIVLLFTLFLIWDYLESRPLGARFKLKKVPWELLVLLIIGADLLRLSQSKSALVCTLIGTFLLLRRGILASRLVNQAILACALLVPPLVFFSPRFIETLTPFLHAIGRDATFTGRAGIWNHITLDTVNPLIGYGYWNFWGGPGGNRFNLAIDEVIPNAHNGYADMYLDGGFLGLFILYLMLATCGGRIIKYLQRTRGMDRYYRMRFAILIAAIVYNMSESSFARIGALWFTALMMMLDYPFRKTAAADVKPEGYRQSTVKPIYRPSAVVNQ
jgi:exopolysaccharide production protein ExoQ